MISYLTPDPITFNTAVVTMVQKKGGTSAGLALTTCLNMFAADERNPSANKTIVLMTDGDVNDAKSAIKGLTEVSSNHYLWHEFNSMLRKMSG